MLEELSKNIGNIQAEIDAHQDELEAERRELYPELYENEENSNPPEEVNLAEEEEFDDEDNEFIVRLRTTIADMHNLEKHLNGSSC